MNAASFVSQPAKPELSGVESATDSVLSEEESLQKSDLPHVPEKPASDAGVQKMREEVPEKKTSLRRETYLAQTADDLEKILLKHGPTYSAYRSGGGSRG